MAGETGFPLAGQQENCGDTRESSGPTRMSAASLQQLPAGGNNKKDRVARESNLQGDTSKTTSGPSTTAEATNRKESHWDQTSNGGEYDCQRCADGGPGAGYPPRRHGKHLSIPHTQSKFQPSDLPSSNPGEQKMVGLSNLPSDNGPQKCEEEKSTGDPTLNSGPQ